AEVLADEPQFVLAADFLAAGHADARVGQGLDPFGGDLGVAPLTRPGGSRHGPGSPFPPPVPLPKDTSIEPVLFQGFRGTAKEGRGPGPVRWGNPRDRSGSPLPRSAAAGGRPAASPNSPGRCPIARSSADAARAQVRAPLAAPPMVSPVETCGRSAPQ